MTTTTARPTPSFPTTPTRGSRTSRIRQLPPAKRVSSDTVDIGEPECKDVSPKEATR